MSKAVLKALPDLIEAGLLSEEQARRIRDFYQQQPDRSSHRALLVFGILGALLVGLGIILIIAHNWDQLSRSLKTVLAFLPLVIGQAVSLYVLLKKSEQKAWREAAATFLFLAFGACISMISQIYNIPGEVSDLLLIWMVLGLPLVYIMRSSMASFIFLFGITYYGAQLGYSEYPTQIPYWYWILFLLILPHYYLLIKKTPSSNFTIFHHWIMPLSLIITLGTFGQQEELLMFLAYFSLFGWLYLIGQLTYFDEHPLKNNGFLILGSLGSIILLLMLSFDFFWEELYRQRQDFWSWTSTPEFWVVTALTLLALAFLYLYARRNGTHKISLMEVLFLVFLLLFGIGFYAPDQSLLLVNILLLVLGILYIRKGTQQDHLGILNYGLLIITALILCRFFDTKWSFILRGVLFVMVGIGFFIANYQMIQKRKNNN
jgi:uncharacterized membrane protein